MTTAEPSADDDHLARRAALGDRASFATLVRRHGPGLFRYAAQMLDGDVHAAEDCVQEALAKAWTGLPSFRGEAAPRTWLFRITANEVRTRRRRSRPVLHDSRLLEPLAAGDADDPHRRAVSAELWQNLQDALHELPWRQRASWVLRELEGLSYAEIAVVLQTSPTVVRGQLHRARRTLAVRMVQWR